MRFDKGDTVRLKLFHRCEDKNGVVREYQAGDRFTVLGYAIGSPDVRCEDARRVSTVLLPVGKLAAERVETAGAVPGNDGDHAGGGPVG